MLWNSSLLHQQSCPHFRARHRRGLSHFRADAATSNRQRRSSGTPAPIAAGDLFMEALAVTDRRLDILAWALTVAFGGWVARGLYRTAQGALSR